MDLPLIVLSSVTYALKGRDILRQHGIKAYVERVPKNIDADGCGYCIYVNGDLSEATRILTDAGIKIRSIHGKG